MTQSEDRNLHPEMKSRSIMGILLCGIVIITLIVIPVSAAKLSTPILLSPASNQHLNNAPCITTLVCKPVTGADGYEFIVQYKDGSGNWVSYSDTTETVPYLTILFLPDFRGRWRVITHDSGGGYTPSTPSAWRTFDYLTMFRQLSTPVPISPANNIIFYHYPAETTLAWGMVPGASGYYIEIDSYDAVGKYWTPYKYENIPGGEASYYNFQFVGAQVGRWRVQALCASGYFLNSEFSPWRKFTYKV